MENFRGTPLNPKYVAKENSPWSGNTGGLDYMVNAEYFREMIKKHCGLEGSGDISFDDAMKKIYNITASFETGRTLSENAYGYVSGNFDGSSMSEQIAWGDSISQGASKYDVDPIWKELFEDLGKTPEFQAIQIEAAQEYVNRARTLFERYNLTTERGLALCFDIAVLRWNATIDVSNAQSEEEILALLASSHGDTDFYSRWSTIANGSGTVHGIEYDLNSKFNLGDRTIV